ncbi:nucleoside deaminase [Azohydromonas aeria]|uniref:nucleoside deaminase n=1 Tax=Azohydromonas aeria TaxID=2590212 RepID=UPI0012F9FCE4|nr:nucleoside deaminase [Azohydromonas aeria]
MSLPTAFEASPETLDERDALYLRRAIALSAQARERGNRPFGAVIADARGRVLAEACNSNGESGDCTAHAEVNALRLAAPSHAREVLAGATMYASGEPCVMCAGAIFWSGIRRVVFGIDAERLRDFRGDVARQQDIALSCRDVFDASPQRFVVHGPCLVEEAAAPHQGAWAS